MEGKNLSETIDHLLDKHHQYLRDVLPVIKKDLASIKALSLEGKLKENVDSIHEILQEVDVDISQHLMKEENILFPTIKDMEESVASGQADGPIGCGVQGPVSQMLYEHNVLKESLNHMESDIQEFSGLIQGTQFEGEKTKGLIRSCLEMKSDLLTHIKIEEEDLFPRAMNLESKVSAH